MNNMNNLDPEEIAKFNKFASDWWDPEGKMKPLHQINPLRLKYISRYTNLSAKKVLDVGCGGGLLSEAIAQKGGIVTGIDLSKEVITVAQKHAENAGLKIDYQLRSVESLIAEAESSFEVVTCLEMLEHVPDPAAVIQACSKLVAPGGFVFFSTIHRNPKAYLFAILGAEYLLNLLPKGTHDYKKFIRPSELNEWAEKAGLTFVNLIGMTYSPLKKVFSLTPDSSVNYLCTYQKK